MFEQFIDDPTIEAAPKDGTTGARGHSISIRVLILEDRPEDAELMTHELRRSWFQPTCLRLETEIEYVHHLRWPPDVILADYHMPQLDAPARSRCCRVWIWTSHLLWCREPSGRMPP